MKVILYKNTAPPNKINKKSNLKNAKEFSGVKFIEKGALDILKPSVLVNYVNNLEDMTIFNYMYIPNFKRYYYIDNIQTEGGLIRYDGRVDVLMSHKTDILNSKQYVIRAQKKNPSPYLEDSLLPIKSSHVYKAIPFGIDVDNTSNGRVILATTGNGGTPI